MLSPEFVLSHRHAKLLLSLTAAVVVVGLSVLFTLPPQVKRNKAPDMKSATLTPKAKPIDASVKNALETMHDVAQPATLVAKLVRDKNAKILDLSPLFETTDDQLAPVKEMHRLEKANLYTNPVTDQCLQYFVDLPLTYLCLGSTQVSDAGMKQVSRIRTLQWLDVGDTKVSAKGLQSIVTLPALKDLAVDDSSIKVQICTCSRSAKISNSLTSNDAQSAMIQVQSWLNCPSSASMPVAAICRTNFYHSYANQRH